MSTVKNIKVNIPEIFKNIFKHYRYHVYYGGRGGGKSWAIARALIIMALTKTERTICAREVMKSLAQSVHQLLSDQINLMGVASLFEIQREKITCIPTGSTFTFVGLSTSTVEAVKSMEGCTKIWVEEAQVVSERSWSIIIPTIRAEGSEFYISFNPDGLSDPTYKRFITDKANLVNADIQEVNYYDNPHFPKILQQEMESLKKSDYDAFCNIWLGKPKQHADSAVFAKKVQVDAFKPSETWSGPYFGLDFGFAIDPCVLTKCYIDDRTLYIEYAQYLVGLENDLMVAWLDGVPDSRKYIIRADCSRPEHISYLKRNGFPKTIACKKWSGCIEDGVDHIRSYDDIVIHPRNKELLLQMSQYSYKVDKLSGDILPVLGDKYADGPDSIRYAIEPVILGHKKVVQDRPAEVELNSLGMPVGSMISGHAHSWMT